MSRVARKRLTRRVVGVTIAAVISIGVAAPVGLAQDYGESPNNGAALGGAAGQQAKVAKCIAKAQTKFGDNKPKLKEAIKKCKKKKHKH
jgi:hypothetical protein